MGIVYFRVIFLEQFLHKKGDLQNSPVRALHPVARGQIGTGQTTIKAIRTLTRLNVRS